MDIWRAGEVLNRRKWLILFSMVVAIVLTYGATRLTGSRFEATVSLISPQTAAHVATAGTSQPADDMEADTRFNEKALKSMYTTILLSREVVEPAYKQTKEPLPTGTNLFKDVEFDVVGPRLYQLKITSGKPDKAAMLANAMADSFVERNHSLNTEESEKIVNLLRGQLHTTDVALAQLRQKYRSYSSKHKVIGTPDDEAKSAYAEIDAERIRRGNLQEELAATTTQLNDTETRLAALTPLLSKPRPVQTGPHAKVLADELDRLASKLATLQARYGNQYPEVKDNITARDTLQARLKSAQTEEAAVTSYEENDIKRTALLKAEAEQKPKVAELQAQLSVLDSSIAGAQARVQEAKNLGDPYGSIASEVAAKTEEHTSLTARLNSAQMALDIAQRQNPIVIMERVNDLNPAVNVTSGKTKKLLLLAALCALIGSCGIVIGLDSMDRRLKTVGEAEKLLPARVLAAIPQPEGTPSYSALARIAELNPRSLPAEAYRFLGLHLLSPAQSGMRSLMVVSAKAEQGSTTTVTNLAITLAQSGSRVVLVDANVRTPEIHKVFEIKNGFGFTDLLMDPTVSSFEKALLPTNVGNLQIITSGSAPDNPWELFRSSNLKAVSNRLRDIADYVLYDTPSGVLFTDALNLAPIVDGAFLCVRALEAPTGVEKRLIEMIGQADVEMLGAVLSDVPVSMVAGYENYQHYYAPALASLQIGMLGAKAPDNPDDRIPVSPVERDENNRENKILVGRPHYDRKEM